ncbi:MAG: HAD-IA family hydrolase [Lachnospiraceae bacterium]|nr:HAD-IA family hydrolase [Lachnospiraceae bacterium]
MKKYSAVLFDLDGTLLDTGSGIKKAVCKSLDDIKYEIPSDELLSKMIGPPLKNGFIDVIGIPEELANVAVDNYRYYYENETMLDAKIYHNILQLLELIKIKEMPMGVATSKPEKFAVPILEHFNMSRFFENITGSSLDGPQKSKSELIIECARKMGISNLQELIYIGDRGSDISAANSLNVDSVAVYWGYGSREELNLEKATYYVDTVDDLIDLMNEE